MTNIEPKCPDYGKYNMKETADLLGMSRETLRGYVYDGLIKRHDSRGRNKYFFYGSEIKRFWRVNG